MEPAFHGEAADPGLAETRLRKVLGKQIGLLHFRLSETRDRESLMYGPVWGVDDLDAMGEAY